MERFARCSHPFLGRLRVVTGPCGVTAPCPTSARLVGAEGSILKVREENSVKYQRTFLGCEMVDWLVQEGEAESRKEAVELGQALLEHRIIQHGERGEGKQAMSIAVVPGTNPLSWHATSAGQVPARR